MEVRIRKEMTKGMDSCMSLFI